MDAAVQALEYEKLGYYNVTNFYDDALESVNDPGLMKILRILLKKEYPFINAYDQYFTLLECNGDEAVFKEKMESPRFKQTVKKIPIPQHFPIPTHRIPADPSDVIWIRPHP